MDLLSVLYEDFQVFPKSLSGTWRNISLIANQNFSRIDYQTHIVVCHSILSPENSFIWFFLKLFRLDVRVLRGLNNWHPPPCMYSELMGGGKNKVIRGQNGVLLLIKRMWGNVASICGQATSSHLTSKVNRLNSPIPGRTGVLSYKT